MLVFCSLCLSQLHTSFAFPHTCGARLSNCIKSATDVACPVAVHWGWVFLRRRASPFWSGNPTYCTGCWPRCQIRSREFVVATIVSYHEWCIMMYHDHHFPLFLVSLSVPVQVWHVTICCAWEWTGWRLTSKSCPNTFGRPVRDFWDLHRFVLCKICKQTCKRQADLMGESPPVSASSFWIYGKFREISRSSLHFKASTSTILTFWVCSLRFSPWAVWMASNSMALRPAWARALL